MTFTEKAQLMRWRDTRKEPTPVNKKVILAKCTPIWAHPYIYIGEYMDDDADLYWMPLPKSPLDDTYYVNLETNEVKKVDKNDKTPWEKKLDAWDSDATFRAKIIDSIMEKEKNKMKKNSSNYESNVGLY